MQRYYIFEDDCKCSDCNLIKHSMQEKSENLLSVYPCIPTNAMILYHRVVKLNWDDCIEIHRKLVDIYNSIVEKYRRYSGMSKVNIDNKKYKNIYYMY